MSLVTHSKKRFLRPIQKNVSGHENEFSEGNIYITAYLVSFSGSFKRSFLQSFISATFINLVGLSSTKKFYSSEC